MASDTKAEPAKPITWEEYWCKFGEQLVWNGWVEKYGDYMDESIFAPPCIAEELVMTDGDDITQTTDISRKL